MKTLKLLASLTCTACLASTAHAQMLNSLSVNNKSVKLGEAVTITVTFDKLKKNFCGFTLFYGDGSSQQAVSDDAHPGPFVFTRTYAKPGNYNISVGGREVQGHPSCKGSEKSAFVIVENRK